MMKRTVISLALVSILVILFLAAPVSAAGLVITNGEPITATDEATSPVFRISESNVSEGSFITIDLSTLKWFIEGYSFTNANVEVSDDAAEAHWIGEVDSNTDTLILTSTDGPTEIGENVTVTFTGATIPWISDMNMVIDMYATRSDAYDPEPFAILIDTPLPPPHGLDITNGEDITETTGATSPIITITESEIAQDDYITIDVSNVNQFVANGTLTDANILISDNAALATWTGAVADNTLTLTSAEGPTSKGENVTVTFTGAEGEPWVAGANARVSMTATRTDGFGYFTFVIATPPPDGLSIANGEKITEPRGSTSPVITITESEIVQYDSIIIDISNLTRFVANGPLTDANVLVTDDAADATWTGVVGGTPLTLTLTSNDGPTHAGENVTITFDGAKNPWIPNSGGETTETLKALRTDGFGLPVRFNFVIDTATSPIRILSADFSGSPTSDIAPMAVSFTDLSKGGPTEWNWDFGDDTTSTEKNPEHIYTQTGPYTVSLTVWNADSMSQVSKTNYINVLNGALVETDTGIIGLTITNCGGPQTITVNTSILNATLNSAKSVLEIQPPTGSGFKNIIFKANEGGFTKNGVSISGNPVSVHMVSEDIAPPAGFSDTVGKTSSFWYSIDLKSYPCNGKVSTKIWEGVTPGYDNLVRRIAAGNNAAVSGTAYSAKITLSNFPSDAFAKVSFSINASWVSSLPDPGLLFIWRIADDEKSGQILPTRYLNRDPVTNLDYFEADSPRGLSTFGISSLTGSNNPFQVVAFVAAQAVNNGGGTASSPESQRALDAASGVPTPDITQNTPVEENKGKPAPLTQPAMSTNVGMFGWLLSIIENNPMVLAMVIAVVSVVAYFSWYKRHL